MFQPHPFEAAFAEPERVARRTMTHRTFGHLAPKAKNEYTGWVLFTHGCHGDITLIEYEFTDSKGKELCASPWLFEDVNELVNDKVHPDWPKKSKIEAGEIWRWEGTYRRTEDKPKYKNSSIVKEGRAIFRGRLRKCQVRW